MREKKLRGIIQGTFSLSSNHILISAPGMCQHTDTKLTRKGVFSLSKEDYSYLNLLIECNTNSKEKVAPLWDWTVSHVVTFTAEVFKKIKLQRQGVVCLCPPPPSLRSEESVHSVIKLSLFVSLPAI